MPEQGKPLPPQRGADMLKPFSMIFFIMVMVWAGSIFVSSDANTRIERSCAPISYIDKMVVAVVQLVHEPYALPTHELMLRLEHGCRFTVWKTFYEQPNVVVPVDVPPGRSVPQERNAPLEQNNKNVPVVPAAVPQAQPSNTKASSVTVPEGSSTEFNPMPKYMGNE